MFLQKTSRAEKILDRIKLLGIILKTGFTRTEKILTVTFVIKYSNILSGDGRSLGG